MDWARMGWGGAVICLALTVGCGRLGFGEDFPDEADGAVTGPEAGLDGNLVDAHTRDAAGVDARVREDAGPRGEPSLKWVTALRATGTVKLGRPAIDGMGNVYAVGMTWGELSLGGVTLGNSYVNAFLASFDTLGVYRWTQVVETSGESRGLAAAANDMGVAFTGYVAGSGTIAGEPYSSLSGRHYFIVQGTATGSVRRVTTGLDTSSEEAVDVAMDAEGNVYIAGTFLGNADFGGGTLTGTNFLASYDRTGAYRWSKSFGGAPKGLGANGSIVCVAGGFTGTVNLGGADHTSGALGSGFLACYSALDGSPLWDVAFGSADSGGNWGIDVAVDADSSVFATGLLPEPIDVGGGPISPIGAHSGFLARFDSGGALEWAHATPWEPTCIDVSGSEVLVTGEFRGTADFGGGPTTALNRDGFILLLSRDGAFSWVGTFGNNDADVAKGAAFGPGGSFVVAAETGAAFFGTILPFRSLVGVFER